MPPPPPPADGSSSSSAARRKKLDLRSKLLPRFRRASDDDTLASSASPPDAAPVPAASILASSTDAPPRSSLSEGVHHNRHLARETSAEEEEALGEQIGAGAARGLQELLEPAEIRAQSGATAAAGPDGTSPVVLPNGVNETKARGLQLDTEKSRHAHSSSLTRSEQDSVSPTAATAPGRVLASSTLDVNPRVTVEEPSPPVTNAAPPVSPLRPTSHGGEGDPQAPRKQSLAHSHDHRLVRQLYEQHRRGSSTDHSYGGGSMALDRTMMQRKIWVKRTGASATLVQITEDDLVDDVREMILKKYSNSLGRSFDAPDVTLRIVSREHSHSHRHVPTERVLGPEEHMTRTLDTYYPGGQTVDEALIIDVPIVRRTPRHSPQVPMPYYSAAAEDMRPAETDQGYFPPVMQQGAPSPSILPPTSVPADRHSHQHHGSISVLNTGMVPPIPSPGTRARAGHRPRLGRNNTASPTAAVAPPVFPGRHMWPDVDSGLIMLDNRAILPNPPPLPTPPLANQPPAQQTSTPPARTQSPRPAKHKRPSRKNFESSGPRAGPLLDGTVPPINVLIVEDNIINLKLLEAFMKRLKVRWHTAMNGRDAVKKWKEGGFHLVLMDIQLPIMNGLEATKEIRRLERCNGVGVQAASETTADADEPTPEKDQLGDMTLFKSSVIIVALTASSLQSDRHEALAAGCNDFLTKPVNFVWLERKVTEWGCMQALIDFDGWRAWKELPTKAGLASPSKSKSESAFSPTRTRASPSVGYTSTAAAAPEGTGTSTRGPTNSGYGSSSSPSSEHSGSGHHPPQQPQQQQPELHVQAPTPPSTAGGKAASPRLSTGGFDGASPSSARRPSPLVHSSSTPASPPQKPVSAAGRASPKSGASSPVVGRSNGTTNSGGGGGGSPNQLRSPREREYDDRKAKRASASIGLGVTNGRLSGVTEEHDDPNLVTASQAQAQAESERQKEREVGSVGA